MSDCAPTHVIDIECPAGCGEVLHVPAVETPSAERTFGRESVTLKGLMPPTFWAQIRAHNRTCPVVTAGGGSERHAGV